MDQPKNWTIYVLQCQDNKYYVGKTQHPNFRLDQHFNHQGSQWTIKYKPIKVLKLIEKCDSFDEDKYTRILMSQFGVDNVRGGSYCQIDLPEETKKYLGREIEGAKDLCFHCKKPGHFIRDCPVQDWSIIDMLLSDNKDNIKKEVNAKETDTNKKKLTNGICKRCGYFGHSKYNCFAKQHRDGTLIQIKTCSRCHRQGHNVKKCHALTDVNGSKI
jgi:hypothetical protein